MKKCCICKKSYVGFGNNPDPVRLKGRCCDNCNTGVVIPMRIGKYVAKQLKNYDRPRKTK